MNADGRGFEFEFLNASEVPAAAAAERRERQAARATRGLVRFAPRSGVIYLHDGRSPTGCWLQTRGLTTAVALLDWIYHLRGKAWFTPQHLADFLEVVQESCGDPRGWGKAKGRR